jgi:hypothetical protein
MARKSIAERIAQLDAQKKALQARAGKQERANDTRRKVLLGALVLHRLENAGDVEFSKRLGDWLRRELPGFLTRDSDKALLADLLCQADVSAKPSPDSKTPSQAVANSTTPPTGQAPAVSDHKREAAPPAFPTAASSGSQFAVRPDSVEL